MGNASTPDKKPLKTRLEIDLENYWIDEYLVKIDKDSLADVKHLVLVGERYDTKLGSDRSVKDVNFSYIYGRDFLAVIEPLLERQSPPIETIELRQVRAWKEDVMQILNEMLSKCRNMTLILDIPSFKSIYEYCNHFKSDGIKAVYIDMNLNDTNLRIKERSSHVDPWEVMFLLFQWATVSDAPRTLYIDMPFHGNDDRYYNYVNTMSTKITSAHQKGKKVFKLVVNIDHRISYLHDLAKKIVLLWKDITASLTVVAYTSNGNTRKKEVLYEQPTTNMTVSIGAITSATDGTRMSQRQ
jgi:hypothetical protein